MPSCFSASSLPSWQGTFVLTARRHPIPSDPSSAQGPVPAGSPGRPASGCGGPAPRVPLPPTRGTSQVFAGKAPSPPAALTSVRWASGCLWGGPHPRVRPEAPLLLPSGLPQGCPAHASLVLTGLWAPPVCMWRLVGSCHQFCCKCCLWIFYFCNLVVLYISVWDPVGSALQPPPLPPSIVP